MEYRHLVFYLHRAFYVVLIVYVFNEKCCLKFLQNWEDCAIINYV